MNLLKLVYVDCIYLQSYNIMQFVYRYIEYVTNMQKTPCVNTKLLHFLTVFTEIQLQVISIPCLLPFCHVIRLCVNVINIS